MKKWLSVILVVLVLMIPCAAIPEERTLNKNVVGEYYTYGVLPEPLPNTIVIKRGHLTIQGDTAYIYLEHISFEMLWENFNSMRPFKVKRIVLELFSFGGSLFDAMAMASLIREQEVKGTIIEVRARGLVASAGLIILVSGTKGYRYVHPVSMVMFHELKSLTIAYDSPSDKEEAAKVERFIQEQVNHYIVDRSKISIQELRERIQRREFWMDAQTAIKYGFADKLLGN